MSGDAEGAARAVLAERLSALREESGRTYASLARRIGVSGSTLHRYCTGRTVPAEFAPVERLARLCGAPAEDREALHRLWLLADGERLDRQGVATPPEGVAGPPAEGARSGPPDEEPPPAVPSPGTAPEAAPVPALTPVPGSGSGSGSGSGQSGAIWRRTFRKPSLGSRRARRYGQGLGVLAAAVLVLALVVAFGRPWSSGPDGRTSVDQVPGGPPADAPEAGSSGSPTPEKPQGTASGSRGEAPSGSPRPTTQPGVGPRNEPVPRPSGSSSAPAAGRVPFTWT
ncbi:helix-turn-helix domain-containing protein, partial [Streptomyces parvus]|uniref:helix-turn-helix domain-containing protein n=1 Tax=Streptomyces parvus TaxID=66428 RepID=UPI0035E1A60F